MYFRKYFFNYCHKIFNNGIEDFDKMKNHFRGNVNGKWTASGTDEKGRKWYGWANNNWVFLLNGTDTKYFKMAIDAFKYVEE